MRFSVHWLINGRARAESFSCESTVAKHCNSALSGLNLVPERIRALSLQ
jgi:hypothetical protein